MHACMYLSGTSNVGVHTLGAGGRSAGGIGILQGLAATEQNYLNTAGLIGNVSSLIGFFISCLGIQLYSTHIDMSTHVIIGIFLSPILLLLNLNLAPFITYNGNRNWLSFLSAVGRYFPPLLITSGYLLTSVVYDLIIRRWWLHFQSATGRLKSSNTLPNLTLYLYLSKSSHLCVIYSIALTLMSLCE